MAASILGTYIWFSGNTESFNNDEPTSYGISWFIEDISWFIEDFTLVILVLFIMRFLIISIIYRKGYLTSSPDQDPNKPNTAGCNKGKGDNLTSSPDQDPNKPSINSKPKSQKDEYEEWYKEQNFSAVLAGFSLTALVFVLGFEQLHHLQRMVEFFFIGFILEMLSFLLYKYMVRRAYEYYGTVLQFAGLLSILSGFVVFIIQTMIVSPVIIVTILGAYIAFFILVLKQLGAYVNLFG